MNSKIIIFFLFLFFISGCGVKSDPIKYPETAVDSYVNDYTTDKANPEKPLTPKPQQP